MSLISFVRVSEVEDSEGEGESSEKRILINSAAKKTPPGRHLSRTPSSKKRPQPVHASDAEFHQHDKEGEIADFGDNYYDNENEFEDVMAVGEEEHEGSGSYVKVKGAEASSSGKMNSKKAQKNKKTDVKPKPRWLQGGANTRTQSVGLVARRAAIKDGKGGNKMHVVTLNDLNEKVSTFIVLLY